MSSLTARCILILSCYFVYLDNSVARDLGVTPRQKQTAVDFLNKIQGYHQGKNCEFSIRMFEGAADDQSSEAASTVLGEVLLVDKKNRELYLPIDLKNSNTQRTKLKVINGSRVFHFEYMDLNPDPRGAKYEHYLFEAVLTPDLQQLEYVEFGIRSVGDQRIYWSVCHLL